MVIHPARLVHLFIILSVVPIAVISLYDASVFASADMIFKQNKDAVVVIATYDKYGSPVGQGSGFIVSQDGAIVTSYHVISNAKDIKIKAGDKVLTVKGLVHIDRENDIVILRADGKGLPTVKLGDIDKARVGEKIYVISSPKGLENTISDGILSGIREIVPGRKLLQITAPVSSGSSGGPVFNEAGEVIGIATFIMEEAQNINFAIPVNLIKDRVSSQKLMALADEEIKDYAKSADYWFLLGYLYYEAGRYSDAIEAYRQAIRLKPDFAEAYSGLGVAYGKSGRYSEAIEALKQAIRLKPDYAEIHYGLGVAYGESGRYSEAIEAYKQAIRLKPDYAKPYYGLGLAYGVSGRLSEEREAYRQAIRLKPDYADAHYILALTYVFSGDRGLALEEYKILKNLDPQLANVLLNLIFK